MSDLTEAYKAATEARLPNVTTPETVREIVRAAAPIIRSGVADEIAEAIERRTTHPRFICGPCDTAYLCADDARRIGATNDD